MNTDYTSFILIDTIEDLTVCDDLIELHQHSPNKSPAYAFVNGIPTFTDPAIKDSVDLTIFNPGDHHSVMRYFQALKPVVDKYVTRYERANAYSPWGIIEPVNIQYYRPDGGYKAWHTERSSNNPITSTRHLVFMTYLNDVTDGGETEFYHQNLKIPARKGSTVIWPTDWTHTHRGIVSPSQEKYIITGWFNYT